MENKLHQLATVLLLFFPLSGSSATRTSRENEKESTFIISPGDYYLIFDTSSFVILPNMANHTLPNS